MIYLDNAATTKPKPEAIEIINRCLIEDWGNPSSIYSFGTKAKDIINKSRKIVADFIGAKPSEIIFTSGSCEANSLAICGHLNYPNPCFITTSIEHKSIMDIAEYYFNRTNIIDVDRNGFVDIDRLKEILAVFPKTMLVSIQYANNEIGTIQNIEEISKIVHKYNGLLHTDATQIIPDRKIDVKGIDLLSFSGQKLGTPKGIGVLYVKNGIKLKPIIYGSQENGIRGGTENVPYIAALGKVIENFQYPTGEIRDYFVNRVLNEIKDCYLVGCEIGDNRLKNNASICFKGVESESVSTLLDQKDIFVSSGSACNSSLIKPSHVLEAIRIPKSDINSVIRFTFNNDNTKAEVDIVVNELVRIINMLRRLKY